MKLQRKLRGGVGPSRSEEAGGHMPTKDEKGKKENGRRKPRKREVKVAPPTVHPKQIPGATSRVRCGEKEKVCGRGENEVREVVSACSDRLTDRNMVDKF